MTLSCLVLYQSWSTVSASVPDQSPGFFRKPPLPTFLFLKTTGSLVASLAASSALQRSIACCISRGIGFFALSRSSMFCAYTEGRVQVRLCIFRWLCSACGGVRWGGGDGSGDDGGDATFSPSAAMQNSALSVPVVSKHTLGDGGGLPARLSPLSTSRPPVRPLARPSARLSSRLPACPPTHLSPTHSLTLPPTDTSHPPNRRRPRSPTPSSLPTPPHPHIIAPFATATLIHSHCRRWRRMGG